MKTHIKIAIVEDHLILRTALKRLLESLGLKVVIEASNGSDLVKKLKELKDNEAPSIFLVDIEMPIMDGFQTVDWLNKNYFDPNIIILTMHTEPTIVMRMVKLGIKSFLPKSIDLEKLQIAISNVSSGKVYFPDEIMQTIVESHSPKADLGSTSIISKLTQREIEFVKLASSEMTYAEIANLMSISLRTLDNFRDSIFAKLGVKSRTGLVLKAIKLKLINI